MTLFAPLLVVFKLIFLFGYLKTYAELFGFATTTTDAEDDLNLDEDDIEIGTRRRSLTQENKGIAFFGPRQVRLSHFTPLKVTQPRLHPVLELARDRPWLWLACLVVFLASFLLSKGFQQSTTIPCCLFSLLRQVLQGSSTTSC